MWEIARVRAPWAGRHGEGPLACVVGDMDIVRPLGLAGVRCAAPAGSGDVLHSSRFVRAAFAAADPAQDPERFAADVAGFAAGLEQPPVIFYEGDWDLLAISRNRDRLGEVARFVIADAGLVEDLIDKARFQSLASRLGLPVPPAACAAPTRASADDFDLPFPLVVKPLVRRTTLWNEASGGAKAIAVRSASELRALWPRLARTGGDVLLQALVPGPEDRVESYHAYVDAGGAVAGEFTGRKIRTHPACFGHSSAVEITAQPDVRDLGRELMARMGLRGVAKLDFKRTPEGGLKLLEVNPRFSLWHHPGALAGVNLPALVYADLTGRPRPRTGVARAGVRWCHPGLDLQARRAAGVSWPRWFGFVAGCSARSRMALDDPLPALAGARALLRS